MMSNILINYMKNRFKDESVKTTARPLKPGPVVTISREYGCPAKRIAEKLAAELNRIEFENYSKNKWHWISKEILDNSANELHLKPKIIREVANSEQVGLVDDIVKSLSHRDYPGDIKIKKTIREVIRTFAEQGHVIIVGRGGVSITRDIERSLHIKIEAPLEWRINEVSKMQMITLAEAKKKIHHIDHQRELLMEYFTYGKKNVAVFDVTFNYYTLDVDEIIAAIVRLMELKNLI